MEKRSERTIHQSDFKFNLGDTVIITNPDEMNDNLKGLQGKITYRGYTDTSSMAMLFPNLYCLSLVVKGGKERAEGTLPGIPERFLTLLSNEEDEENNKLIA